MIEQGILFILHSPIRGGLILMEKCPNKAENFPGEWFIPGGRIEDTDKDAEAAMIREMREELGCLAQEFKPLPLVDATDIRGVTFLMRPFLVAHWVGEIPTHCKDQLDVKLEWMSVEEVRRSPTPMVRAAIALACPPS